MVFHTKNVTARQKKISKMEILLLFMGLFSRTPIKLNGKFYQTTVRSTMFYGIEYWVIKNQIEKVEYKER